MKCLLIFLLINICIVILSIRVQKNENLSDVQNYKELVSKRQNSTENKGSAYIAKASRDGNLTASYNQSEGNSTASYNQTEGNSTASYNQTEGNSTEHRKLSSY